MCLRCHCCGNYSSLEEHCRDIVPADDRNWNRGWMSMESRGVVLHVEDEPMVRDAMGMLLRGEGYGIMSAANGAEAMRLVAEGLRPDVLIVDFNLEQEMNGAEVAEELRRALCYTPPVIMLTGNPASADLPWITDAPVWLARKPIDAQLLLAALPSLVQFSRATRKLKTSAR